MTECPRCRQEVDANADFCPHCRQYMRWAPTGEVRVARPARPAEPPRSGSRRGATRLQPIRMPVPGDTARQPAARAKAGEVRLSLRAADGEPGRERLIVRLEPGTETVIVARIHNRTPRTGEFAIVVSELPDDWWSAGEPLRLNPYGTAGRHEGEVEIRLRAPRSAGAAAGPRPLVVSVMSNHGHGRAVEVARAEATLDVAPFRELSADLRPALRAGHRRGRYAIVAGNDGNAPAAVTLAARDDEDVLRMRLEHDALTVPRGGRATSRLTARPAGRHWIGRARPHPFTVTVAGADADPLTLRGTFKHRPLLPWWLAVVIPIALAAAALAITMVPKHALVPDLRGAKSPFAAQQELTTAGLRMSPSPVQEERDDRPAGSVVAQDPPPGTKVDEGAEVTVVIAAGSKQRTVPRVIGMAPPDADRELRKAGLTLGSVEPQPADLEAPIKGQLPEAGLEVEAGTAVNVTLDLGTPPGPVDGGGEGDEPTPAPTATPTPTPGEVVPPGGLLYDDGAQLMRWDEPGPQPVDAPGGSGTEPAWSADGKAVAYMRARKGGRGEIVELDPEAGASSARVVTDGRGDYRRPAYSPAGGLLAYIDERDDGGRLCLQPADGRRHRPSCLDAPGWRFGRRPAWSPDATTILAVAQREDGSGSTGLFAFRARGVPTARARRWSPVGDRLLVKLARSNAVAWSPDGATIAVAADDDRLGSQLWLLPAGPAGPQGAPVATNVPACELAWSPDGLLAVSQYSCGERIAAAGPIAVIDPAQPGQALQLPDVRGANPAWPAAEAG